MRSPLLLLLLALLTVQSRAQFCSAGFNDSIDSLTVYITNEATGSYNWIAYDMGDGTIVPQVASPSHTYAAAGVFEVCQLIQDTVTGFCFEFECDTLYLGGATCQSDFVWFPNGLEISFYSGALGIFDSLSWEFGDGSSSNDTLPVHTYANAGTYTVCHGIYNNGALCDSMCYYVMVDTASSCEADFDYSTDDLDVDFTNLSTGNFTDVLWDFGDGFGTSQNNNPSYTYFTAGTYEVCLEVFDMAGNCYDELCMDITVSAGGGGGGGNCEADFTYLTEGLDFEGTDASTGTYLTAIWDFGDGSAPSVDGEYTYEEPGEYEVCLTIGNIFPFCFSSECKTVEIIDLTCDVEFSWSFNEQNVFSFKNEAIGDFDEVEWSFGDGNTSSFDSPAYTYNEAGNYEVCLTTLQNGVMCGVGCQDVSVYPLGLEQSATDKAISIYPNPSEGSFCIENPYAESELMIYDVRGSLVYQSQMRQGKHLIAADLAPGSYTLRITSPNASKALPLLVR